MPGFVKTPKDEKLWTKAVEKAKEQNPEEPYALANHIFHKMKGKKASSPVMRVTKAPVGYYVEVGFDTEGPLTAAQTLSAVHEHLKKPNAIVMSNKFSLGRAADAVGYTRAPYVVYDRKGNEVDSGFQLHQLWHDHFDKFLGWRNANSRSQQFDTLLKPIAKVLTAKGFTRTNLGVPGNAVFTLTDGEGSVHIYDQSQGWDSNAPVQLGIKAGWVAYAEDTDANHKAFDKAVSVLRSSFKIEGTSPYSKVIRNKTANMGTTSLWGAYAIDKGVLTLEVFPNDPEGARQRFQEFRSKDVDFAMYTQKPMRSDPQTALRALVRQHNEDGATRGKLIVHPNRAVSASKVAALWINKTSNSNPQNIF